MIFFLKMFKGEILSFLLILVLLISTCFLSFKLFFQKEKILFIERTSKSTRVLEETHVTPLEIKIFIRRFLVICLNYHEKNYLEHIESAGNLMSPRLWNEKKEELLNVYKEVKAKKLEQGADILEIKAIGENEFEILAYVSLYEKEVKTFKKKFKIFLTLKEAKRTKLNVWGLEVENFKIDL